MSIETVDSFQGKQLDAVILSCVRAKDAAAVPTSGVGFVSDIRRQVTYPDSVLSMGISVGLSPLSGAVSNAMADY